MSVTEVVPWVRLRARPGGFKFRRQHPAGRYVLDFFCGKVGLAVEVDGISHDIGDGPVSDAVRDAWLREQDIKVLRIAASDIARDADAVIETIVAACHAVNPLHHPSATARFASRLRDCDMPPACRRTPLRPPPRSGEETV